MYCSISGILSIKIIAVIAIVVLIIIIIIIIIIIVIITITALAQNPISTKSYIWDFVRQYGIMFVLIRKRTHQVGRVRRDHDKSEEPPQSSDHAR